MKKVLGGIVAIIIVTAGLNGGIASAASTSFNDNGNDASADIDLNRVTVNRLNHGIAVRTHFSDFGKRLNAVEYFFDTKRRAAGPEYGALIYRGQDGDGIKRVEVYRMKSYKERGAKVNCHWRYHWYYNGRGPGYFNAKFPLGCFEGHGANTIRAHVKTWNFTRYKGHTPHRRGVYGYFDHMGIMKAWTNTV